MNAEEITIVNRLVAKITEQEVREAEVILQTKFPTGYEDFITKFGEGVMTEIRIYPPRRIVNGFNNFRDWRKRTEEHWYWNVNPELLTKEKAVECIIIADTFDADELIFHPQNPDAIYFLPRHDDKIYCVETGFYAALEWYCSSGILTQPYKERTFESFDFRKQ